MRTRSLLWTDPGRLETAPGGGFEVHIPYTDPALTRGALEQVAPLLRLSFQRYAEPVLSGLAVIARQPGLE